MFYLFHHFEQNKFDPVWGTRKYVGEASIWAAQTRTVERVSVPQVLVLYNFNFRNGNKNGPHDLSQNN